MQPKLIKTPARTTREIRARALDLVIPKGTEFTVIKNATEEKQDIYACEGLGVSVVWRDDFEILNKNT